MRPGALLGLAVAWALLGTASALADGAVSRDLVIRNHRFEPPEIDVPAGQHVVIHVRNLDPTAEELNSSALRVEKVIAGNGEGTVRLHPLEAGRHKFMGEYHPDTAQGVVVAK